MTEAISPALVDRMVALVRDMNGEFMFSHGYSGLSKGNAHYERANRIFSELPAPVDPDLRLARQIAAKESCLLMDYENGAADNSAPVRCALSAIKATRLQYTEGKA